MDFVCIQLSGGKFQRGMNESERKNLGQAKPAVLHLCSLILNLEKNYYPKVLKQIENFEFQNLNSIYLASNRITSIQGINRISFPFLAYLDLRMNNLTTITQLRKAYIPKFRELSLDNNRISDGEKLYQVQGLRIRQSSISLEAYDFDDVQCHDASWIAKMINQKNKSISIMAESRIEQKSVKKKVEKNEGVHCISLRTYFKRNPHIICGFFLRGKALEKEKILYEKLSRFFNSQNNF